MARSPLPHYTVPSLSPEDGARVAAILQDRLNSLTDLHLTLKHVHWNVVGPNFIAVHEMLDPQVDAVRAMVDAIAERIATLGVSPVGTPGALVAGRSHALNNKPRMRMETRISSDFLRMENLLDQAAAPLRVIVWMKL